MRSRTFLNVSLGILALAAAYHLGARTATAQSPGSPVVSAWTHPTYNFDAVVTANGDVYARWPSGNASAQWAFQSNVFGSATPTTSQESFGSVKARYRGEREPQGVKPSTNR